jgi:hypothetical protein
VSGLGPGGCVRGSDVPRLCLFRYTNPGITIPRIRKRPRAPAAFATLAENPRATGRRFLQALGPRSRGIASCGSVTGRAP